MPSAPARVSQRDAAVPMRGHRLDHQRRDVSTEILVDFWSADAIADLVVWTTIAARVRVKIGAGSYAAVGSTRATAASLGAFSADETKDGTIEVTVPGASDDRHEELTLRLGLGV
jgi:hypothetical protein